ncbi:HAMP domain-containing protein [Duganella sp. BJB488]|uniref:type IV pili methyl-accepting chemotaxis transducer N-terminal domain-containing protein n=1 Tax=unclassified Duganella TaxID=2636909 RepID=UPI000E35083C|nr:MULTISPECIES: type IV pili methyl-accepting chemotaxis transducer N-terminal domain-containing protein [unclassified Duganella]NVD71855.1 type IV pili methyl-accepting chemotaxis transducer N-terminal domain-containing protein [Duganella sp. BJB1802]RFP17730.1 HAMP domain-containing protein [Duganella sp. BJB489]RFP22239.1 HAMP domain-containing protein [Duganella sp. BJB488]RFP37572.1 HAMP domain-containing protein [Duganella sp. BJB480]
MLKPALFAGWQKLSTRIVGLLLSFLAIALTVIGSTLLLSWQLEGSAAAINVAGSLRMDSYRLALLTTQMDAPAGRQAVSEQLGRMERTLDLLRRGDPQRPLFLPPTASIRTVFAEVQQQWRLELSSQVRNAVAAGGLDPAEKSLVQQRTERFVERVDLLVQRIERDSESRTFWLRASQLLLLALALLGTISIIYLLFDMIVAPVTRLQGGIERMREQDFSVRLPVDSNDEFGMLAHGFNQMADKLQDSYSNLERRVQLKTAELEHQNRELALLYDSASFLQQTQSAEAMCKGFLQRISDYFSADGGSVRILDPNRGNLHMLVHQGISEELVESERCLKVGECLCGEAVVSKLAVIHDLRRKDDRHTLKCHREGFATISIFHIFAQRQYLGFFNLHFRTPTVFSAAQTALLETLGQLLGTAIENLRLQGRDRELAVSEERNLVAQGLHDSIAQGLNFLNLQVQMLEQSLQRQRLDEVESIVPALRAGVEESYQDVRELLHNFRTRLQEGNLVSSLETVVDKFRRQSGIAVDFEADSDGAPFPREHQLQLLFIVQEALSNVRKHASATQVWLRLKDEQDFTLSIRDNGHGFDPAALESLGEAHVGLNIMRERAQRIDAQLQLKSAPGAGTEVLLRLPRAQRRAA